MTREARMFSMDRAVRAQFWNAPDMPGVPNGEVLNALAGKVARLVQPSQQVVKLLPEERLSAGKLVRLVQPRQAETKLVPAELLIRGKLVRPVQFCQAL